MLIIHKTFLSWH